MIVTRDKLIGLARQEIEERAEADEGVLSGYLIGSVVGAEPVIAGAADVDLVIIHAAAPPATREIKPLSEEVHLDITHHHAAFYAHPTLLRVDPWWGPALCEPVFLYDPQHIFERAQAGARGQFHRPDHVVTRAQTFLARARAWRAQLGEPQAWPRAFLAASLTGANAAASLAGFPAAGRRLALELEARATSLQHPQLYTGFLRLLGAGALTPRVASSILGAWARAFDAAWEHTQARVVAPPRRIYYWAGFQGLLEAGRPDAVVWPLLDTWERAIDALQTSGDGAEHRTAWQDWLRQLGIAPTETGLRTDELENYLDYIERLIEQWAVDNGA